MSKKAVAGILILGTAGGYLLYAYKKGLWPFKPAAKVVAPAPAAPPATKTLSFSAAKNPGAGGPNRMEVRTDLGLAARLQTGGVSEWKNFSVEIPAEASWVEIVNVGDGSALQIKKYPLLDGLELKNVVATYGFFREYSNYWITDGLRFAIK